MFTSNPIRSIIISKLLKTFGKCFCLIIKIYPQKGTSYRTAKNVKTNKKFRITWRLDGGDG